MEILILTACLVGGVIAADITIAIRDSICDYIAFDDDSGDGTAIL